MSQTTYPSTSGLNRRSIRLLRGLASLAVIALLSVRWYTTHQDPTVTIPNPVMPTPNAFDFYVKAGNAITNQKRIQIDEGVSSTPTVRYTLAQKDEILRQNSGVIDSLHAGFAYPYVNPPMRSFDTDSRYYSKFREVARLLALQGQVRTEEGDWGGAAESYLDAMQMGEEIPHGSPLIGALVGIGCQAIGRRPMWKVVDHLDALQTRAAIDRLTNMLDRDVPFADSLQEEKWQVQAEMMDLFHNKPMKSASASSDTEEYHIAPSPVSMADLVYFFTSKKRIMHDFTVYMDQSSEQARQPYSLHLPPLHEPTDVINKILLPVFMNARFKAVDCETQNALLLVTLALHAFRLEQGHYPNTLAELAPGCLKRLPNDPFAAQGTFHYRLKGQSYLLYSVGPDGKDDGGTPIYDVKKQVGNHLETRYSVEKDSIGDVIAGTNL
jgi:type II secretory pathway pseudopilin PulG